MGAEDERHPPRADADRLGASAGDRARVQRRARGTGACGQSTPREARAAAPFCSWTATAPERLRRKRTVAGRVEGSAAMRRRSSASPSPSRICSTSPAKLTRAGSRLLEGSAPAKADATAVARLRAAGFVLLGRTNMTEFAYSGLGLNPHYGTPLNPWRRSEEHIPRAVPLPAPRCRWPTAWRQRGSAPTRAVPAAFQPRMCCIVGYKPTAASVPRDGVLPLSESLDSVGALANSVACCAHAAAGIDGRHRWRGGPAPRTADTAHRDPRHPPHPRHGRRRASRRNRVRARRSTFGGARLQADRHGPARPRPPAGNQRQGRLGRRRGVRLASPASGKPRGTLRPPRSRAHRTGRGTIRRRLPRRQARSARTHRRSANRACKAAPPSSSPRCRCWRRAWPTARPRTEYARLNLLALRNPSIANVLDDCALSLPIHDPGEAPVGMNLLCLAHQDEPLLALGRSVEKALKTN